VEIDSAQGVLRLSSEGLFANNEAVFTEKGRSSATALMEEMAQLLPCYASPGDAGISCAERQTIFETVLIEGHTDTNPSGRIGGNWALSTDRARAFMELMAERTPALRALRNGSNQPLLGLAGYGDSRARPGIAGTDERNRRIEIRFLLARRRETDLAAELRRLDDALKEIRLLVDRPQ
jgi:flagellar motor protein MotB